MPNDEEEMDWTDLEVWVEDLKAKYLELEEQEFLTPKEQADFNEKMLDVITTIIVNMRIMKEEFKMFENVYKLKGMGNKIQDIMGIGGEDGSDEDESSEKKPPNDHIYT